MDAFDDCYDSPCNADRFLLMLALRIPLTNCSLAGVNAYSTIFAVYYGGFYHQSEFLIKGIIMAFIWGMIGNALDPLFGYLSIYFSSPKAESTADTEE